MSAAQSPAERAVRAREQLLATALTSLDHPVFVVDAGVIRFANPAAAREYGWSQTELEGMTFESLSDSKAQEESARPAVLGEEQPPRDQVHRRRDGTVFSAALTVSQLLADGDGDEIRGAVVSVHDAAPDRARAEQQRHSEKMVALGELVAGVAHEINNPLTGISAFAELLLEDALSEEQRESVQLIKRECDRATAVIRDLLVFARKGETPLGPVNLNTLVEQTLRLRAYQLRDTDIEVVRDLDTEAPVVQGDAQKLQQVLINLIMNAEHAMHGRDVRRLTIRTRHVGPLVEVDISDTGHGMSPAVRSRLFEPFFTTKPPGVGTGLGLSVSYGITQAHRGTISVDTEEGRGTTISLRLPASGSMVGPSATPS